MLARIAVVEEVEFVRHVTSALHRSPSHVIQSHGLIFEDHERRSYGEIIHFPLNVYSTCTIRDPYLTYTVSCDLAIWLMEAGSLACIDGPLTRNRQRDGR